VVTLRALVRPYLSCLVFSAVLLGSRASRASQPISPAHAVRTARSAQGLGQLVVTDSQSQSPVRLDVSQYHVNVVLQPPVALVQIDQSFYNPYVNQQEGTFILSLPRGASVSRFAMYVTPQQLVEGELIERQQATNVYDSIVSWRRDPGILEQIGDNLFKMRVFPVPPRDSKRILLDYTIPLEGGGGQYQFRLPLFSDLKPIAEFALSGSIIGQTEPKTAKSESHPETRFVPSATKTTFALKCSKFQPHGDFLLAFKLPAEETTALRSYIAETLSLGTSSSSPNGHAASGRSTQPAATVPSASVGSSTYFQVTLPAAQAIAGQPSPADVIVAIDTSSSTRGNPLLRTAVCNVIKSLRPGDRFRLISLNEDAYPLTDGWQAVGPKQLAAALAAFDREVCMGAANLDVGLQSLPALAEFDDRSAARRMVIYIGSGKNKQAKLGWPELYEQLIPEFERLNAAVFAVMVQHDAPLHYIEPLVRRTGGLVFDVADYAQGGRGLSTWLTAGMPNPDQIVKLDVEGASADDLFHPASWLPGSPLTVLGKTWRRDQVRLTLTIRRGGKESTIEKQWTIDPKRDDVFLGRFWAQRKLRQLCQYATPGQNDSPRKAESVALAQEWSLLTPYTAFLVLESEQDYANWKIDRRQRRRYWSPPGSQANAVANAALPTEAELKREEEEADREYLQAVFRDVRQAMAQGMPRYGILLLRQNGILEIARKSNEFRELLAECEAAERFGAALHALGPQRALFDPAARPTRQQFRPELTPLVLFSPAANADFLIEHPYARQLLRPMQTGASAIDGKGVKLGDVVAQLRELPGVNVVVDFRAIAEAGSDAQQFADAVSGNDSGQRERLPRGRTQSRIVSSAERNAINEKQPFGFFGPGRISIRDYARFVLAQHNLVLVEEPYRLLITTRDESEKDIHQIARFYPAADLLVGSTPPGFDALADPYLAHEEAARRRIQEALQRPISLDLHRQSLREALAALARKIGDTILVDANAIVEAGVPIDTAITAQWQDVPAGQALEWIVGQVGMEWAVRGSSLIVTSPTAAESDDYMNVRLHSARGLVCGRTWTVEEIFQRNNGQLGGQFFQMGGMGGGMMGGSIGMGGMGMGGMGGMGMGGGVTIVPRGAGGPSASSVARATPVADGTDPMNFDRGDPRWGQVVSSESLELEDPFYPAESVAPVDGSRPTPQRQSAISGHPFGLPPSFGTVKQSTLREWQILPETVEINSQSLVDLVSRLVDARDWVENGGSNTQSFFGPTLDLAVSASDKTHEKIDELFTRLRKTPVRRDPSGKLRALTTLPPRDDEVGGADLQTLQDLITNTVSPKSWEDGGGPCGLRTDSDRLVIGVSADPGLQYRVSRLLTMLRRSRYEMLCHRRPWENGYLGVAGGSILPILTQSLEDDGARAAQLPPAPAEDLALLAARRETGSAAWQATSSALAVGDEKIVLRRSGNRVHIIIPQVVFRIEGSQGAIASTALGLVELGNWGETLRQVLDSQLPWMPHRSNAELARIFRIERLNASARNPAGDVVSLRLLPRIAPPSARLWIEACFSKATGLPVAWESRNDGKLISRLRFDGPGTDFASRITWEDASGRVLATWQALKAEPAEVPPLASGWKGELVLDRRSEEPAVDRSLKLAIGACQALDWPLAAAQLERAAAEHPHHPLIALLSAWCFQQDRAQGDRKKILSSLRDVAASGKPALIRVIGEGIFSWLTPGELYETLLLQSEETREAADWDHLVHAAQVTGKLDEAIQFARRAVAAKNQDDGWFPRNRLLVELLLQSGQMYEALAIARRWSAGLDADDPAKIDKQSAAEQLTLMGEMLARFSRKAASPVAEEPATPDANPFGDAEPKSGAPPLAAPPRPAAVTPAGEDEDPRGLLADRLFARALDLNGVPDSEKCSFYCRWAAARPGLPSCRLLLRAAEILPCGSKNRSIVLAQLLSELSRSGPAEESEILARTTKDPSLRQILLQNQAYRTYDGKAQSELGWRLYRSHLLADGDLSWICRTWNTCEQYARVIDVMECKIRLGRYLSQAESTELSNAYKNVGRERDARRAVTDEVRGQNVFGE
jgi:Ca-activated chloride channel homolog